MNTPAGSGRHIINASLEASWDSSLAGWWNFNDATANDSSSHNNDGVLYGNAAFVQMDDGYALSLDGSGDYVDLSNSDGYVAPGGSFTVLAWVYSNEMGGTVIGNSQEGEYWKLWHNHNFGGKWMFDIKKQDGTRVYTEWHDYVTEGRWRQVAGGESRHPASPYTGSHTRQSVLPCRPATGCWRYTFRSWMRARGPSRG